MNACLECRPYKLGDGVAVEHRQTLLAARLLHGTSPLDCLPVLVRLLRRHCDASGLGGGLLFDGEWVVMLFDGPHEPISAVLQILNTAPQLDPGLLTLGDRTAAGSDARVSPWVAGYAEPELISTLRECVCGCEGGACKHGREREGESARLVQAFKRALATSDAL